MNLQFFTDKPKHSLASKLKGVVVALGVARVSSRASAGGEAASGKAGNAVALREVEGRVSSGASRSLRAMGSAGAAEADPLDEIPGVAAGGEARDASLPERELTEKEAVLAQKEAMLSEKEAALLALQARLGGLSPMLSMERRELKDAEKQLRQGKPSSSSRSRPSFRGSTSRRSMQRRDSGGECIQEHQVEADDVLSSGAEGQSAGRTTVDDRDGSVLGDGQLSEGSAVEDGQLRARVERANLLRERSTSLLADKALRLERMRTMARAAKENAARLGRAADEIRGTPEPAPQPAPLRSPRGDVVKI